MVHMQAVQHVEQKGHEERHGPAVETLPDEQLFFEDKASLGQPMDPGNGRRDFTQQPCKDEKKGVHMSDCTLLPCRLQAHLLKPNERRQTRHGALHELSLFCQHLKK